MNPSFAMWQGLPARIARQGMPANSIANARNARNSSSAREGSAKCLQYTGNPCPASLARQWLLARDARLQCSNHCQQGMQFFLDDF